MADFRMPSLGADMDFGRVVEWRVKIGDRVKRGEIIVEVETDKGTFEVESPHDGAVQELVVPNGAKVPVGAVLAMIRPDGAVPAAMPSGLTTATPAAGAPVPFPASVPPPPSAMPAPEAAGAVTGPPAVSAPHRRHVSPLARRVATELGVDLTTVTGTGAGGAVTRTDVERAAGGRPAPAGSGATVSSPAEAVRVPETTEGPSTGIRRAIAAAVSRSKREIPHYYLSTDVDLGRSMSWLEKENLSRPIEERLLPSAVLLKAVASALVRFGDLNGFWIDHGFRPGQSINVGVAISLRSGGLIAPAIHDTDRKSLVELMHALRDLVQRARSGGLRGSEMTDATTTVTSLGDQGVTTVYGIIYPPQVAIVGIGKITERAWAVDGMLAVRPVVTLTLAADHRATDGHYGGLFLAEVARLLQSPETL